MAIKYYINAAVSEFEGNDGKSKRRYQTIGVIVETRHGLMLSLESIPLLGLKDGKLLAFLNEPGEKNADQNQQSSASESNLDDIPF